MTHRAGEDRSAEPAATMPVRVESLLPAPPQTVWSILVDFAGYPAWISTLQIEGVAAPGAELDYGFRARNGRTWRMPVRVVAFTPGEQLSLRGGMPGLVSLRQEFTLRPEGKGTRLVHEMNATGLVVLFVTRARLARNLARLATSFNRCLVERLSRSPEAQRQASRPRRGR